MLTAALGPIRDFNGGLIVKQNERLEDFLNLMPDVYDEFLLENFFYSINPIVMQSILPPLVIKEWFLAFSKIVDQEEESPYSLFFSIKEESVIAIVKGDDFSFKESLHQAVNDLEIPSLEIAFAELTLNGICACGFLYRPSLEGFGEAFCHLIQEKMKLWANKKHEEQVLRICLRGSESPSLDPRITKSDMSHIIIKMLYEGLMRMGPDGKLQYAIAQRYEISQDRKKYTFYLRESRWSNGTPVTAYDFEYSWKKALHPSTHSVYSNTFFVIKNARLAKENKISVDEVGIYAKSSHILEVDLEYPSDYFPRLTAHWTYSLINSHIDRKYPEWAYHAGDTYVCNGPFKLAYWKHQRSITVVKNPFYWDTSSVNLNQISIHLVDSGSQELRLFENGEIDFIGRPLSPIPPYYPVKKDVEKVTYPLEGIFLLWINTKQFPFNNKKIRQAFAHAIDRNALIKTLCHEYKGPTWNFVPPNLSSSQEPLFPDYNPVKARQLFDEGLQEIGLTPHHLYPITLSFCSGMQREELFELLCQQWQDIFGIEITLESTEWRGHFNSLVNGEFYIGGMELHAWWHDAGHLLEYLKNASDLLNISNWENQRYSSCLNEANNASSPKQREVLFKELELLIADEVPLIPLYQLEGIYLKKSHLKDIFTSEFFDVDFKWAYKEKMHYEVPSHPLFNHSNYGLPKE